MSSSNAIDAFWQACTAHGVVSKKLSIHHTTVAASPVGLRVSETIKHGAPLINVPYTSVVNAQTLRGDLLPHALPPLRKATQFLTRRGRMGVITAHSLWLASFLACHAAEHARGSAAASSPLQPFLNDAIYPTLPRLTLPANAPFCPSLRALSVAELAEAGGRIEEEIDLTHALLRHYGRRRGVSARLCPHREAIAVAYRTVMQRAMLLPWSCEPSAPGDLSELLAASPDLALTPSLVPVIDLIRAAPPAQTPTAEMRDPKAGEAEDGAGQEEGRGNCALLTCVQSDFLSAASRRRIIVETAPLAARRVVVCATKAIKEGEELLMDFE